MLSGKIHEGRQRRLTKLRGPAQRNFALSKEFEREQTSCLLGNISAVKIGGLKEGGGQLKVDGFHNHKLSLTKHRCKSEPTQILRPNPLQLPPAA
jgi:hypothetical protein